MVIYNHIAKLTDIKLGKAPVDFESVINTNCGLAVHHQQGGLPLVDEHLLSETTRIDQQIDHIALKIVKRYYHIPAEFDEVHKEQT